MGLFGWLFGKKRAVNEPQPRACGKCAGPALTIDELNERSKSLGMFVQPDGTIIAPPSKRSEAHELENLKGFQCAKCGAVYCMGCVLGSAPPHPNGGKACFKCRGNYKLVGT